jgi:diadenylate cyclase
MSPLISLVIDIIKTVVQIGLLAVFIYVALIFLRGTRAAIILTGIIMTTLVGWVLAEFMQLDVLRHLLSQIPALLAFAIVIIFQPELRRAFAEIGSNPQRLFGDRHSAMEVIDSIVDASFYLRERRIGALIVLERDIPLRSLAESGVLIDAPVSGKLLQTIFHKNTPLHDGAVLIRENIIVAASCFITKLTEDSIGSELGTRHRAGVGVTEESDAITVIVSEETGHVSLAHRGRLAKDVERQRLRRHLTNYLIKKPRARAPEKTTVTKQTI